MAVRTVTIDLLEQNPKARTLRFTPDLTSVGQDVLLDEVYTVVTEDDGTGSIDLPVKTTGSIRYTYELPGSNGKSVGEFFLTAGAAIDLASLLLAGGVATDSIIDYINARLSTPVVISVAVSVSPTAADSGKYYRLGHANPTFNLPTTGLIVGETEFWVTFHGFAGSGPGIVDAGAGNFIDFAAFYNDGSSVGTVAQAVNPQGFLLVHFKYVAANTWASDVLVMSVAG